MKKELFIVMTAIAFFLSACGNSTPKSNVESENSGISSTHDDGSETISISNSEETEDNQNAETNEVEEYDAADSYWKSQGMDVPEYDSALKLCDTLEFYYSKTNMYVFANGVNNEDDIKAAGTSLEQLESEWFDRFQLLIFPKKFKYDNYQYCGYVQIIDHMLEEGTSITSLRDSNSEVLEDILNQTKERLGIDEMEFITINGIEYASSFVQTLRGIGEVNLTIQDGNVFLFYFDADFSDENFEEMIDFKNYILGSIVLAED